MRQFSDDIDFILSRYWPIELRDVILCVKNMGKLPANRFLLTFDDGFREIHDIVAPILISKGVSATIFISSAFLDNKDMCFGNKASLLIEKIQKGITAEARVEIMKLLPGLSNPRSKLDEEILKIDYRHREIVDEIANIVGLDIRAYLKEIRPYLSSSQVGDLINNGFSIGAHSIDHPDYSRLSLSSRSNKL